MGGVKLKGTKDVNIISKIAKEFDMHLKNIDKKWLTADEIQNFKKDIYRRVRYDRKRGTLTLPEELTAKTRKRRKKGNDGHREIRQLRRTSARTQNVFLNLEFRRTEVD